MKTFSIEDLAKNNGKDGTPALIAYNGKIYDVTNSSRWVDGDHESMHIAGKDLTVDLETMSPHGPEVMDRFKIIGILGE